MAAIEYGLAGEFFYFKIELGALLRNGKMVYLSNVSSEKPTSRTATSGEDEKRLYMTWQEVSVAPVT